MRAEQGCGPVDYAVVGPKTTVHEITFLSLAPQVAVSACEMFLRHHYSAGNARVCGVVGDGSPNPESHDPGVSRKKAEAGC